jgi:maleylacetate reductase
MLTFEHVTLGQRVLFGSGMAAENLASEVSRLGSRRVMVLASEFEAQIAAAVTAGIDVASFYDDVAPHVPVEKAEKARSAARELGIDLLVCVGGGSTTGLAKAIAMTTGLPIIAVPTTYAGSEATNVWGITEASRKSTGVDDRVLPVTVIYDAALTLSLPVDLSVASGLNALAHCVDSMWAPRADPINQALAAEGIRALNQGLPLIKDDPSPPRPGTGPVRGVPGCGRFCLRRLRNASQDLPCPGRHLQHAHAQTHATVLPYVLAFNAPHAPAAAARIAAAFGTNDASEGLNALREALEAPRALKDHGLLEANITEAAALILPAIPASNPRPVTAHSLERLLRDAYAGSDAGLHSPAL